jgi:CheY-like chemotaxis protein
MNETAGLKLLIADDHAPMRQMLRALLSEMACEVCEAADGAEAVRLFAQHQPDWVIMDIRMKPMSGLVATRQILATHPGARIVVVTEHRGAEYEQAAREAGACAFVLKEDLKPLLAMLSKHTTPNSTHS